MPRRSNYDKFPVIPIGPQAECDLGWRAICERLRGVVMRQTRCVLCAECYPGSIAAEIEHALAEGLRPARIIRADDLYKTPREIDAMLARHLGDDPVFGRMNDIQIDDFLDLGRWQHAAQEVAQFDSGLVLVIGTGAALVAPAADVVVYADMARREIQMRQRRNEIPNLGADNCSEGPGIKYKRAFFVDWRAADRLKKKLLPRLDYLLDTHDRVMPKMISGEVFRRGLALAARRPFRVVPYFDPGPWGGHWMEEICDLPKDAPNHAWCFDCVPEENSLLLGFGSTCVQIQVPPPVRVRR